MVIALRPRYTRTPTEVHTYPDRGTHVSRPRYTCIPTEVRMYPDRDEQTQRPKCADLSAPTTYHPLLKKAQLSSLKLCLILFYTELSQVHNKLVKVQFLKNIVLHLKSID